MSNITFFAADAVLIYLTNLVMVFLTIRAISCFHCHATKKLIGNRPVEGAKKMKCYKRLIYKLLVQVSSLCGLQFLSYLQKRFTHPCMETTYWCTVLVHQYGGRKSTKTSGIHFFYKSSFFSLEN